MSNSRLEEMSAVIAELKERGVSLDAAIAETEYRLHLLRAIRRATETDNGEAKPRGRKAKEVSA